MILNSMAKQAHKKMLNISNHQGNAKQNHGEKSPLTCQKAITKKKTQIKNVGKDVEKREPSSSDGGNINCSISHCENSMRISQKTKNRTMYDPAILLLDI